MKLTIETWRCLRYRLLILYDGQAGQTPGQLHRVNSPNYTVWLVRSGQVELFGSGKTCHTVPGSHWVCIPPSYERLQRFAENSEILSVHFTAAWPTGNDLLQFRDPIVAPFTRWRAMEPALQSILATHRASGSPISMGAFASRESGLLEFLALWYELLCSEGAQGTGPRDIDPRLARAIDVIDRSGYCGSVPYKALRETCNLSRVQIDRLFRSSIGKSPHGYMEERVLERVVRALVDPALSIKELCLDLGFASTAHFNQWFRRLMGLTPGEYRDRLTRQEQIEQRGNRRMRM